MLAKGLEVDLDPRERRRRVLAEAKKLNLGAKANWPNFVKLIREDRER